MTTTLVHQVIDRKALERVLDAPSPVVPPELSDNVVDAMAQLRRAIDDRLMSSLKADAKFLLSVQLPEFDHGYEHSVQSLQAMQEAAVTLQNRLQAQVRDLQFLARDSAHPAVRPLLATVLDANAQAFEHVERVRWAAMNAEAEAEIKAGAGKSFGSMDAALAYLAKQR